MYIEAQLAIDQDYDTEAILTHPPGERSSPFEAPTLWSQPLHQAENVSFGKFIK